MPDDDLPPEPGEPIPPRRRGPRSRLDVVREHIGVLPDREVAAMVGLSTSAVTMYRKKYDIPASGAKGGRKSGRRGSAKSNWTDVRSPDSSAGRNGTMTTAWAWKVTLAPDLVRYVVAADATAAASVAERAGEVVSIERLCEGFA